MTWPECQNRSRDSISGNFEISCGGVRWMVGELTMAMPMTNVIFSHSSHDPQKSPMLIVILKSPTK